MPYAPKRPQRYYVTLSRGEQIRCFALRPLSLFLLMIGAPALLGLGGVGVTALTWRGSFSPRAEAAREAEMRADYDDRLAALQEQMDAQGRADSLQRASLTAKVRGLAATQETLSAHAEALMRLTEAVSSALRANPLAPGRAAPFAAGDGAPSIDLPLGGDKSAAAAIELPGATQGAPSGSRKPHPEGIEINSNHDRTSSLSSDDDFARASDARLERELASLTAQTKDMSKDQTDLMKRLSATAEEAAERVRGVIAETGLSVARVEQSARSTEAAEEPMGGPYIPVRFDVSGSPMEAKFDRLESAVAEDARLAAALHYLPLGQPLPGRLEVTSPFGDRLDPFLGSLAFHPGDDFRAAIGTPVCATADGKVTKAGYDGGYGNMVEIDHGDGLITRYGHLSQILVTVGERVTIGQTIGRTGDTGRSTGPHLHYEIRVDDRPVDPQRFLRVGETLMASR